MTTVVITPPKNITFDWTTGRHSGWPKGKSRMVALLGNNVNLTYVFPFTPTQVEFSDLSNNYTEIERPGNYKLIERRAPNLTRATFSFLAVDRDSQGKRSIENQLRFLTRIASANAPIAFAGLGGLLGVNPQGNYRLWRITDFSFSVTRKNEKNDASQAECRVTLVEDRNPTLPVEVLSRIEYQDAPPRLSDEGDGDDNGGSGSGLVLDAAETAELARYLRQALRVQPTNIYSAANNNPRALIRRFLQERGLTATDTELNQLVQNFAYLYRISPAPSGSGSRAMVR